MGSITHPSIKEKIEGASLILSIGGLKSDFNTGMFTYRIPQTHTVEVNFYISSCSWCLSHLSQLHSDHTRIRHGHFPGIGMKLLLPKLAERLSKYKEGASRIPVPRFKLEVPKERDYKISHAYFWPRMGNFFRKQDVIVAETGE